MEYRIRALRPSEIPILWDLLYEAIFVPEGSEPPPREILQRPELQLYVAGFGEQDSDICFVAETEGRIAGAVWVRIMDDYGHVDDETPSFAIALFPEHRGRGVGTALMETMLAELKKRGFRQASLAVQKKNYALKLYRKAGFEIVDEDPEEYIMVCPLNGP